MKDRHLESTDRYQEFSASGKNVWIDSLTELIHRSRQYMKEISVILSLHSPSSTPKSTTYTDARRRLSPRVLVTYLYKLDLDLSSIQHASSHSSPYPCWCLQYLHFCGSVRRRGG